MTEIDCKCPYCCKEFKKTPAGAIAMPCSEHEVHPEYIYKFACVHCSYECMHDVNWLHANVHMPPPLCPYCHKPMQSSTLLLIFVPKTAVHPFQVPQSREEEIEMQGIKKEMAKLLVDHGVKKEDLGKFGI